MAKLMKVEDLEAALETRNMKIKSLEDKINKHKSQLEDMKGQLEDANLQEEKLTLGHKEELEKCRNSFLTVEQAHSNRMICMEEENKGLRLENDSISESMRLKEDELKNVCIKLKELQQLLLSFCDKVKAATTCCQSPSQRSCLSYLQPSWQAAVECDNQVMENILNELQIEFQNRISTGQAKDTSVRKYKDACKSLKMKLMATDQKLSDTCSNYQNLQNVINKLKDEHACRLEELKSEYSSTEDQLHQELHMSLSKNEELASQVKATERLLHEGKSELQISEKRNYELQKCLLEAEKAMERADARNQQYKDCATETEERLQKALDHARYLEEQLSKIQPDEADSNRCKVHSCPKSVPRTKILIVDLL